MKLSSDDNLFWLMSSFIYLLCHASNDNNGDVRANNRFDPMLFNGLFRYCIDTANALMNSTF